LAGRALIPLDFNSAILDRAPDAASLLKLLAQGFQTLWVFGYSLNDSDRFATSALGFATNSDDAITGVGRFRRAAYAGSQGALALGAQTSAIGAVDRPSGS